MQACSRETRHGSPGQRVAVQRSIRNLGTRVTVNARRSVTVRCDRVPELPPPGGAESPRAAALGSALLGRALRVPCVASSGAVTSATGTSASSAPGGRRRKALPGVTGPRACPEHGQGRRGGPGTPGGSGARRALRLGDNDAFGSGRVHVVSGGASVHACPDDSVLRQHGPSKPVSKPNHVSERSKVT